MHRRRTEETSVIFTGDLMPGGLFERQVYSGAVSFEQPFQRITPYFKQAELVVSNLECPIQVGSDLRPDKSSILGFSGDILPLLKEWNFHVVNIANNHLHDYGLAGIKHTLQQLEDNKIQPLGISRAGYFSHNSVVYQTEAATIGLASFTSDEKWVNSILNEKGYTLDFYSKSQIKASIDRLKGECDLIVLLLHWGFEKHEYPSPKQVEIAKFAVDSGADLIIGHHPHVRQGYQMYKGKYIFYSLGHLFFSDFEYKGGQQHSWDPECKIGTIVQVKLEKGRINDVVIVPICQKKNNSIDELRDGHHDRFVEYLNQISSRLELPAKEYRRFWLNYHLSITKRRRLRALKLALGNPKHSLATKMKRLVKTGLLLSYEQLNCTLQKQPERDKRYN